MNMHISSKNTHIVFICFDKEVRLTFKNVIDYQCGKYIYVGGKGISKNTNLFVQAYLKHIAKTAK